jgi:DHA1 family bicyclomycin/chloramphenicol resistance-like MFS transporter
MSYVSMMMMLAPLLAPAIGSLLLLWSEWPLIFVVLAVYALIIGVLCLRFLPEVQIPRPADSPAPAFFSSYRLVLSNRLAQPLIAISMFASFSFFCFLTAVPFVYIEHFGVDAQLFSLLFGFNVCALIIANFSNSKLVTRFGSEQMLHYAFISGLFFASVLVLISLMDGPLWVTSLMASLSVCATNADALILIRFPHHSGTATAVIGTLRFGAGAIAGPLLALGGHQSIVPFAVLMFSGVLAISLCQLWRGSRG